jgi:hypothetical protein
LSEKRESLSIPGEGQHRSRSGTPPQHPLQGGH